MKKIIEVCLKIIFAGLAALVVLSVIMMGYDWQPVHLDNPAGNSDYVWKANAPWVKMTEGISHGRMDANGFNNIEVIDNPEILVVGSSHMEATNVMQDENIAYLLGNESVSLDKRGGAYNVGISGHHFIKCCQYLKNNLETFSPSFVVIETATTAIPAGDVEAVIKGTVQRTPSHNTGIVGFLQRIPFCRRIYHQLTSGLLDIFLANGNTSADEEVLPTSGEVDKAAYNALFAYLSSLEKEYDTQIIIFNHPNEVLGEDGKISFDSDENNLKAFAEAADVNGISFIDMSSRMEAMYYNEHHVSHGFCTGLLGSGHLNKYGHAAIADAVKSEILKLQEGAVCH